MQQVRVGVGGSARARDYHTCSTYQKHFQSKMISSLEMGGLIFRKFAHEMALNILTAQRVFCFGQYDRINDFIPLDLRRNKCSVFGQFLVNEFRIPAIFKSLEPLFL